MEITLLGLAIIGILATMSMAFSNIDLFILRCPICSTELRIDLDDDWVWAYEESPLGWQTNHLICPNCAWDSIRSRKPA
jgi:hypothetical protein